MKNKPFSSGPEGETAAARYLENQGYQVLNANYRVSGSEVDLIAIKNDTLCFIEVKSRRADQFGFPEEFVDQRKQRKILRAAKIFTTDEKYKNCFIRFDIISVIFKNKTTDIYHILNAFDES